MDDASIEDSTRARLARFVRDHPRLFVLSGAGISTGSGIPDYRDEAGQWKRQPPVTFQDFVRLEGTRKRYWARSMRGWPAIEAARPNAGHLAVAELEATGRVHRLVTQNVDGLHQRAGSGAVVELHGNLREVVCLDCGNAVTRGSVQTLLEELNGAPQGASAPLAPDGDADVDPERLESFVVPDCHLCGGMLKPDVVFFGENVPKDRVARTFAALEESDAMLVVGSSLMVYSGYRFAVAARRIGRPICAVNLGRTRADALLDLKVEETCAEALSTLIRDLRS